MKYAAMASLMFPLVAAVASADGKPIVKHTNPVTLSKPTGYTHVVEVKGGKILWFKIQKTGRIRILYL